MSNKYLLSIVLVAWTVTANAQSTQQLISQAELRREVIFERYAAKDKQSIVTVAPIILPNHPEIILCDKNTQAYIALHLAKEEIAQELSHATQPELLRSLIANEEHVLCLNKQLLENNDTYNTALIKRLAVYSTLAEVAYVTYRLGEHIFTNGTIPDGRVGHTIRSDATWVGLIALLADIAIGAIKAKPTLALKERISLSKNIITCAQHRLDYLLRNAPTQSGLAQGDQHA